MKTLSIKVFITTLMLILLSVGLLTFYNFYSNSKDSITNLVRENIQTNMLNLKHYLDKNLEENSINQVVSHLDNSVANNAFIEGIHIISKTKKLLYSTKRGQDDAHHIMECLPITQISQTNIMKQKCYTFGIQKFKNLQPYYLHAYVFMNRAYIDSLLSDQIKKDAFLFSVFLLFFVFLFWNSLRIHIINPLELLRQFAYYNIEQSKEFKITEIESIRYSLKMTFHRMNEEKEKLFKLSTLDPLSGLYNRLSLMEKINWLISKSKRERSKFALVFLDLDNFKTINDTQGHEFGDSVLKEVSHILVDIVRENDIVSRFGGDEFVLIISNVDDEGITVAEVMERLQYQLTKTLYHKEMPFNITASMGVAIYPKDGEDATSLLKNADIAMFEAKSLGKNSYYFFTQRLNEIIEKRVHMQKLMQDALDKNHFKLFYQPKVDIQTSKIVSCEALVRLIDPKEGIIPPDQFIPIAETNNFIIPLGKWILQEAVRQIKLWENTALKDVKISVNISAIQFQDPKLINIIKDAVKDIDTKNLDIELTESALVMEFKETLKTIQEIKKLGISLSLDDFGTGYSSLSYLKDIPFDTIKIDKSFIDVIESKRGKSFVHIIVDIANNLDLEVVAEGVETQKQLQEIKEVGCNIYQGYYCSKPLPANEFEVLFKHNNSSLTSN